MNQPTPTDDELFAAYWKDQERTNFYAHGPAQIAEGLRNVYLLGLSARSETVPPVCELEETRKVLQKACDRTWTDETLYQTAVIASNAIYWRDREIEVLKGDLAKALANHSADLSAPSAIGRSDWIAVGERLPEPHCPVLVVIAGCTGHFMAVRVGPKFIHCMTREDIIEPTHWMPLPEDP